MPAASKAASQMARHVIVRGYLKPISTLRRPLASVSFETREPVKAAYERSDVCVVPAAGVAAEAMVALTIARLMIVDKFGGDSLGEMKRNFEKLSRTDSQILTEGSGERTGFPAPKTAQKTAENVYTGKIHQVVKWPDPVLAKRGEEVTVFDDDLKKFVDEMFQKSMYIAQGIWTWRRRRLRLSKRITVIDVSFKKEP